MSPIRAAERPQKLVLPPTAWQRGHSQLVPGAVVAGGLRGGRRRRRGVGGGRAAGRREVDPEARVVELLESDLGGVEAHDRVLADQLEEGAALFFAVTVPIAVGQAPEELVLL